jgi:hypothetical protein
MFGNLEDGPELLDGIPEGHHTHEFHPAYGHCLRCHCSAFNRGVAMRECKAVDADAPVTVQPKVIDWFKANREFSA